MTKSELIKFLKSNLNGLDDKEREYLEEEIRTINVQNDWKAVLKIVNKKEVLKENPQNILALYLLEIAPYPNKLQHHWELADMADIDIDFQPSGRDKIKEWLGEKFGKDNCVSIGTYGTLGVKGSVQEVSRVYNIPPSEYIKVSKLVSDDDKDLDEVDIRKKYPQVDEFLNKHPEVADTMTKLVGMKKNIGQHAGGFIVSSDSVWDNIPIVQSSKNFVTGWQESGAVKELEGLGFVKIDVLGLSCVEQIQKCVELINKNHPENTLPDDIYLLPVDDPNVYSFINTLDLDNVFQMESKVFKEAVRKIRPQSLQDISNISTLIRPGSGNVDDYIKAKTQRREPACLNYVYDHTRGLMIYQEQLMQVLMELGGFDIFDADKVRRLVRKIGKAKTTDENRQEMLTESEIYHKKYLANAIHKIIEEDKWEEKEASEYAEKQWDQIMLQAKYAFNLPHSYAYSLMGYVQAYLKAYYPLEFWIASLSTIDKGQEKHSESSMGKYINSVKKAGLTVLQPNVNKSEYDWYGEGKEIYFALSYIKDVSKGAEDIINHKPYESWEDFLQKAITHKFNKRVVKGLIFSGAVDFEDDIDSRSYKWLLYLAAKKNNKKIRQEIEDYQNEMPNSYQLVEIEYEYCKYSFTGIDSYIENNPAIKNIKTVSQRDTNKKLWFLLGYISSLTMKKSKKSGKEYALITLTDFRESISVFAFGGMKGKVMANYSKGQMVKIAIKNDSSWLKLPWESELGGKFPIEVIE